MKVRILTKYAIDFSAYGLGGYHVHGLNFYEFKQIFLSLVVTGWRQTGQRFDG